jgi:hypothetical protein
MSENKQQDELDYQELIAKVAEIDESAALYMQKEMRQLSGFEPCGDIWAVVVWELTNQGTEYWYNIASNLEC